MALAAMAAGVFLVANDFTALSVAIPAIEEEFGTSLTTAQWVVNGYTVVFGVLIVTGGRLADAVGRRLVFLVGAAIFATFSLAGAFAPDIGWLIVCRALMGMGEREPEHEGRVRPEYWIAVLLGMFALTFQLPQFYFNSDDLWLNREVVDLADGSERVAFVAGTHDGWYTLLVDHDRSIEYVHSSEVVGRVICRAPEADFYLPWWGQSVLGWLSGRPEPQWLSRSGMTR